ncbi:C40 family peptidase [Cellulomonas biazotea]|uniref:NlpC/P60 domain-containing protein n=1 Tax=Cellulomonas biazotea TaxID=1709 RepID=A0A402DWK5_9CELL|nr:C40 family peptidase [Cellulomonas biazotea]GCE78494.1 hypothetical protein CBZ_35500 [Cellulomonas biazotea]
MTLDGIAAVQSRMAELRALVAPPTVTATPTSASTATTATTDDFQTLLASLTGSGASTASTATGGATAQSFIAAAQKYVGVPYVWGGESLSEGGLDCSGLVIRSLADVGVTDFPRVARDQQTMGEPVASLDKALPGDLVVFGGGSHIGIYLGDGKMIDAPKPGASVVVRDVYTTPTAIRRILPQAADVSAVANPLAGIGGLAGLTGLTGASGSAGATAASQRAALELLASLSSGQTGARSGSALGASGLAGLAASLGVAS